MRRRNKELFDNLTILGASLVFAVTAITLSSPISFKTTDDTLLLYKILSEEPSKEVKGASSESLCPKEKSVIGWIDFQGNKKIVDTLPKDQEPSACFSSYEKAKEAGFDY